MIESYECPLAATDFQLIVVYSGGRCSVVDLYQMGEAQPKQHQKQVPEVERNSALVPSGPQAAQVAENEGYRRYLDIFAFGIHRSTSCRPQPQRG